MDIIDQAVERLKMASEMSLTYYDQPLIITLSGGKDSDTCLRLAQIAGIPFEAMHNLTTADAPQTIRHIKNQFHDLELSGTKCTISHPTYKGKPTSMWELIPQKLTPPTRLVRYCCVVLKESGGKNRMITTGVRWEESVKRKNRGIYELLASKKENEIVLSNDNDDTRRLFENCKLKAKRVCNPIIEWTHRNVWDFLQSEKVETNILYQMGFNRVGCIGCPMASDARYKEFNFFPEYERMYKRAFVRLVAARKAAGKERDDQWSTPEGLWAWWMGEDFNQLTLDQLAELQTLAEEMETA